MTIQHFKFSTVLSYYQVNAVEIEMKINAGLNYDKMRFQSADTPWHLVYTACCCINLQMLYTRSLRDPASTIMNK